MNRKCKIHPNRKATFPYPRETHCSPECYLAEILKNNVNKSPIKGIKDGSHVKARKGDQGKC